jgi:arylsulfatase
MLTHRPLVVFLRPLLLLPLALAACGKSGEANERVAHAGPAPADKAGGGGSAPDAPRPKPRGDEHAVFSLIDNRLLAHAGRGGGLIVLPGHAGFAKYLHFAKPKISWKAQTDGGRKVAAPDKYATFDAPLTAAQAKALSKIHVRVKAAAGLKLELKVNGVSAKAVGLAEGWQTQVFTIPPSAAKAGENRVQLVFGKAGAATVEWIQLGGDTAPDAAPTIYDASKKTLVIPQGGSLSWYVQVPDKGRVVADVIGTGCEVAVTAAGHDGKAASGTLSGTSAAVELGSVAGKIVRLDLEAKGCPEARLANAELTVPGKAPVVQKAKKPKYIVFWIMDSLRADRVKPFFAKARAEVPNFEKLATEATVFKNTYVQGNESRASHASIWSGLYPVNHRMIKDGAKLDTRWTTLGEAMKSAGFYTSGVSANGYIIKKWGFGDGWDAYRNHIHDGGGVRGEDVWKFARQSVEKRTDKPFFLYMGSIDTHVSWRAKDPWIAKYSPNYKGRFLREASGVDVEKMATGALKITEEDKQHIIAIYDSNVSYQDDLVGQVRKQLQEWGIADDTMIVITADHGDEQWEAGRVGHGGSLAESLIRVPLVVYHPPLFPAGAVEEGVDTIDILPTLLDAMGLGAPVDAQGQSLVPLAQGVGRGYPRPSIASQYETWHAMRLAGWKIKAGGDKVKLYNVAADPYEKTELQDSRPIERRFVTDAFSTFLVHQEKWKKSRWGVASNHAPQLAADLDR